MGSTESERWAPVPGFPGYEVSDLGRVRSFHRWRGKPGPRILSGSRMSSTPGYRTVSLCRDRKQVSKRVYRLVAAAFLGPKPAGLHVRHLNGDGTDDRAANLAYGTAAENADDQRRHGTHWNARKVECIVGHPFDAENTAIDCDGFRRCRACHRDRKRAARERRRAAA